MHKIGRRASCVCCFLLSAILTACSGPGNAEGEYEILNGYAFYDTGGNGVFITRKTGQGASQIVVEARVDGFTIDGTNIVVARRPAQGTQINGIGEWKISKLCEYWRINTVTNAIERISDASRWPQVKCDMTRTYGAIE